VTVTSLDLQPGGELKYLMTAVAPEQVAFMKTAGMPLTSECKVTYTEVSAMSRLAYKTLADFVPGVAPYEVGTVVELEPDADGVQLTSPSTPCMTTCGRSVRAPGTQASCGSWMR